ncbi:MAG: M23 family metallopeptidase [Candidatus Margulisiibacteriota bacterium]
MKKKYTFLIIPHKSGKMPIEFNMTHWLLASIGVVVVGFVFVLGGSLIYSARMADMSVKYYELEHKSKRVQSKIDEYTRKTEELKTVLLTLQEKDQEIRKMLGLRSNKSYFPAEFKKKATNSERQADVSLYNTVDNLKFLHTFAKAQRRSYDNLYVAVSSLKQNFDKVPSIWPIYGYIMSGFGYRMHPIAGSVHFHAGIDIPSYIGAPVRVAASGSVISAAWESGYGLCAVVEHHNGLRTVYAHLSGISVRRGDAIKKGQLIGRVGNSGLSTGPHLHYEVRANNRPISPVAYLNMDMFRYSVALNKRSM